MFRQNPSMDGLRSIVRQKHLPDSHGARHYFNFLSQGPASVRSFVGELGASVEQPFLDDHNGVDKWLATMHVLFRNLPTNENKTMTIAWVTRRFIAQGLAEAVVTESAAHGGDIQTEVAGIVRREVSTKKKSKKPATHAAGSNLSYTPNNP
ncbi:MAG: hypothetical protein HOG89_05370 [Candidatus Peribacter sp.]|jgi:hypothetical protein|nr:hypothetical protein [Candidatus Peribacter sp.]MBT4393451.1 hypothetical protein [Candidatus Peribacter sp.]MBT4600562.1 hypothetical protein [Candidatus Peribacter sp.]MBT5149457.1 hypothetical protein [Candidatus Peribacter sp.]MBT5638587.1 hypothetical protein [Candidatus Peribacter sp.]